jgi:hypothetical protein
VAHRDFGLCPQELSEGRAIADVSHSSAASPITRHRFLFPSFLRPSLPSFFPSILFLIYFDGSSTKTTQEAEYMLKKKRRRKKKDTLRRI